MQIKTIHRKQIDSKVIFVNETGCIEFKTKDNVDITKNLRIVDKIHMDIMSDKITISILEDVSLLKIGYQYVLYYDNCIEPIILLEIDHNICIVKFVKEYKKYISNKYCIIKGDYKPDVLIVGEILLK